MEFIVLPENYQFKELEKSTFNWKQTFLDRSLLNVYQGKPIEIQFSKKKCLFCFPKDNSQLVKTARHVIKLDIKQEKNLDTIILIQNDVVLGSYVVNGTIRAICPSSGAEPGVVICLENKYNEMNPESDEDNVGKKYQHLFKMKIDYQFVFEQVDDFNIADQFK